MKIHLLTILLLLPAIAMCEEYDMPTSIKEVKTKHEARLLQLPGVVSVGLGRDENGNSAIIVGLERPESAKDSHVPSRLEGYPVVIRIVGQIKAQ